MPPTPESCTEPHFDVVWPLGQHVTRPGELASRPPDLVGKRVGLVWDHVFRGDDVFETFKEVAAARFDGMTFVGHEEFGNVHGSIAEEHEAIEGLPERLRTLQVDAVVVGVGA